MFDDDRIPDPEPRGALVPAPHVSTTSLAGAVPWTRPSLSDDNVVAARELFARVVRSTLDALDDVGDSIATAIGLR
jgi:hypothetical protein